MRAALLLFSLTLVPRTSLAVPNDVEPDSTHGRWSLGLSIGAGAGYRTLTTTTTSETNDAIISMRDDIEKPGIAYSVRSSLAYHLNAHWALEAGVGYIQLGWQNQRDLSGLTFGDIIDPRTGFVYSTSDPAIPAKVKYADRFHYLEFPVGMALNIGPGRWRSVTSLGVAPSVLIAAKDAYEYEFIDGRTEKDSRDVTQSFNTFNLFPYLSTGVAFRPWERWEFRLQPTVRYGVLRIIDTPIPGHLYMGSVDLGVRFEL